MVSHTVLFRFKEGTTSESVEHLADAVYSFKENIQGIVDVFFGENCAPDPKGYTHGSTIYFIDMAALENYREHHISLHIRDTLLMAILDDAITFDCEFESTVL